MNFKLSKFEWTTLAISFLVGMSALYFLFWRSTASAEDINREKAGYVLQLQNDIRRRSGDSLAWLPAAQNETLYFGDLIFCGDDSTAEIDLGEGGRIKLRASTLIAIEKAGREIDLNLEFGETWLELAAGQKVKVRSKGQVIEVKAAGQAALTRLERTNSGKFSVSSLSGPIEAVSEGGKVNIAPGESATLKSEEIIKVDKSPLRVSAPSFDQLVQVEGESGKMPLSWQAMTPTESYLVQLSKDREFGSLLFENRTTDTKMDVEVPANKFLYWKVTAEGTGEASQGFVETFKVEPPRPRFPPAGYRWSPTEEPVLDFSWEGVPGQYRLEIIPEAESGQKSRIEETDLQTLAIQSLPIGNWRWRICLKSPKSVELACSRQRNLYVVERESSMVDDFNIASSPPVEPSPVIEEPVAVAAPPPPPPKPLEKVKMSADWTFAFDERVELEWDPVAEAIGYQLQISSSSRFKSNLVNQSLKNTAFHWEDGEPGEYFVRVRARPKEGEPGGWSSTARLIIKEPPPPPAPELTGPTDELTIVSFGEDSEETVLFQWTSSKGVEVFEVELSEQEDFQKKLLSKRVREAKYLWRYEPEKSVQIFWRVRAVKDDLKSDWSKVRSLFFEVKGS